VQYDVQILDWLRNIVISLDGSPYVKCAHLVPKSLESEELAYLFGVREKKKEAPLNLRGETMATGAIPKGAKCTLICPANPN
jgi:hypothetical protein